MSFRDDFHAISKKLNDVCSTKDTKVPKEQVKDLRVIASTLKGIIGEYKAIAKTHPKLRMKPMYKEVAKIIEFCHNYTDSAADIIADEIKDKEYDPRTYSEAKAKLKTQVIGKADSLISSLARLNTEDVVSSTGKGEIMADTTPSKQQRAAVGPKGHRGMFDALPVQPDKDGKAAKDSERKAARLEQYVQENKSVLTRYNSYRTYMPTSNADKKPHVLMKLPIIALTDPPIPTEKYLAAGYEVENVGLYPIIEEQMIVGINHKHTEISIEDVLKSMNAKSAKKYVLVTAMAIGYKNTPFKYYWVTPERNLNRLYTGDNKVRIRQWGFAFN